MGGVRPQQPLVQKGETISVTLSAVKRQFPDLTSSLALKGLPSLLSVSTTIMTLNNDPNYRNLEGWYKANAGSLSMRDMFDADLDRFSKFR